MARKLQPINAGSMADIAFLLLIFFLVTTTMDVDTGLMRRLPPMPEKNQDKKKQDKIKERNVFVVLINKNNDLLVEGKIIDIHELRQLARDFIANPDNRDVLPEKVWKDIPYFGHVFVTKNPVISLQNDRGTSYGTYLRVQNELIAAKDELRNELAESKFGKKYDDLEKDQQEAIKKYYPAVISEAEPKNVGGGK